MQGLKLPKIFEKPTFWLMILAVLVVFAVIYLAFTSYSKKPVEHFQDSYSVQPGEKGYNDLLDTGLDDQGINSLKYVREEDNPLLATIKMCEDVQGWKCDKLDDGAFAAACGICSGDGINSKGKPHSGGMYVDPTILSDALTQFKEKGVTPKLKPSVGVCNGQFLVTRPYCDVQRDRDYCSKVRRMTPQVAERCGQCIDAETPTFVYMGKRGGAGTGYSLIAETGTKPYKHKARLRVLTNGNSECTCYLRDPVFAGDIDADTNFPREKIYYAKPGTNYDFEVEVYEGQVLELVVKWPEFYDSPYSNDEQNRIQTLMFPKRAPLVNAYYGTVMDSENNGTDVVDVQSNIKGANRDCGAPTVRVSNDVLGNIPDPAPKKPKQLRLLYSDGEDTIVSYGLFGNNTTVSTLDESQAKAYKRMCPPKLTREQAEEKVCTMDINERKINNRTYTGATKKPNWRKYKYWGSTGATTCDVFAPRPIRGITGIWESMGYAPRRVPLEKTIVSINGDKVEPKVGPPKLGTMLDNVFKYPSSVTENMNIPNHSHWFWPENDPDRGGVPQIVVFTIVIPGTFRDTTKLADTPICSSGIIITQPKNIVNPCDVPMADGVLQGPGKYTGKCLKSLFIANGCDKTGRDYPSNDVKLRTLAGDLEAKDIAKKVANMAEISKNGRDLDGKTVDPTARLAATMSCQGKLPGDPCNPYNEKDPPLPMSAECLDMIWMGKGKYNPYKKDPKNPGAPPTRTGTFSPLTNATPTIWAAGLANGLVSQVPASLATETANIASEAASLASKKAIDFAAAKQAKAADFEAQASLKAWEASKIASQIAKSAANKTTKKLNEGFWGGLEVNIDAVNNMNDLGGIKDVQASYNTIYQDLNSKESSRVEAAMMKGYGIPIASNPILVAQAKVPPPPKDSVNAAKKDAEAAKKKAQAARDKAVLSAKDESSCGSKALNTAAADAEAIAASASAEAKKKSLGYSIQTAISQICGPRGSGSNQVAGGAGGAGSLGRAGMGGAGGAGSFGAAGSGGIGGTRGSIIGGSAGSSSSTGGSDGSDSSSQTFGVVTSQLQMQMDLQSNIDASKKRETRVKAPPKPPKLPPPADKCKAPMGNPAPTVSGWKYMGCFKDCAAGRGLTERLADVSSVEQCIALAKAKGYNTSGNQYFRECWAGNNSDWNRMGDAGCCEPMGGGCTQQIYTSGQVPKPPAPPAPLPKPPAPQQSGGINIIDASYGINCNAALKGNRTDLFKGLANGKLSLDNYEYNYITTGGDPAGGCGKTLEINYNCSGGPPKKFSAPPEAGVGAKVNLSCANLAGPPVGIGGTRSGTGINIIEASYGINCNPGLKGNRTQLFKGLADGKPSLANYAYNYQTTGGDPAGGCGKTLEINYNCAGGPVQKFTAPAEAGFNANVNLTCQGADVKKTTDGLQAWYDGMDPLGNGVSPGDGSVLASWNDKSGKGYNSTSAVGSPKFSRNGVVFDGNSFFKLPDNSVPFGDSSYSIYVVANVTNPGAFPGLVGGGNTSGPTGAWLAVTGTPGGQFEIAWNGRNINGCSYGANQPFIMSTSYESGGQRTIGVNGKIGANDKPNGPRVQPNNNNVLGWAPNIGKMVGSISEVILYNINHSESERQKIEGYLAWKWGLQGNLTVTHPFRNAPPTPPAPFKIPTLTTTSRETGIWKLSKGRIAGNAEMPKGDYTISFDLTIKGTSGNWTNIIRVGSGTGDCCNLGQRSPAIWVVPGQTALHVRVGDQSDGNWGVDTSQLTLNKKSSFKIVANGKQVTVTVDDKVINVTQPSVRATGKDFKVFLSDPYYDVANVQVENLSVVIDGKNISVQRE